MAPSLRNIVLAAQLSDRRAILQKKTQAFHSWPVDESSPSLSRSLIKPVTGVNHAQFDHFPTPLRHRKRTRLFIATTSTKSRAHPPKRTLRTNASRRHEHCSFWLTGSYLACRSSARTPDPYTFANDFHGNLRQQNDYDQTLGVAVVSEKIAKITARISAIFFLRYSTRLTIIITSCGRLPYVPSLWWRWKMCSGSVGWDAAVSWKHDERLYIGDREQAAVFSMFMCNNYMKVGTTVRLKRHLLLSFRFWEGKKFFKQSGFRNWGIHV